MLSVCPQHCGTTFGQATAQPHSLTALLWRKAIHSAPRAETPHASLQPTHPALLEGSPEHQPWPPVGLGGSQYASEAKPNKAPHTDPAKGPGSSLIAILASEPTWGKQRGPYFSWWMLNALLCVPICHWQPLLTVERNPEQVSDLLLLLNFILWQAHQTPEEVHIQSTYPYMRALRDVQGVGESLHTLLCHACKLCSIWARE